MSMTAESVYGLAPRAPVELAPATQGSVQTSNPPGQMAVAQRPTIYLVLLVGLAVLLIRVSTR